MPISDPRPLTRRGVLAAGLVGALLGLARPVAADATSQATSLVATLADELQRLVNSGGSERQIYRGVDSILSRYADIPAVAASVLGPPWRGASASQRQAFVAAFQSYLARKYGSQFREYQNASIAIRGARDGGRAGVLVQTTVRRPGKEDIAVDWQVSDRSGSPRVVNLVIEGVSMLANERAEIGAMLEAARGDVNGLIAQLQARA